MNLCEILDLFKGGEEGSFFRQFSHRLIQLEFHITYGKLTILIIKNSKFLSIEVFFIFMKRIHYF